MESVNLEAGYFQGRKARRLRARLGEGGDVYPVRLWCYCAEVSKSECLRDLLPMEIEEVMLWKGKPGELFAILASPEIGSLEQTVCPQTKAKHYHAHHFDSHNGHIIAFHKRARKAALARWKKVNKNKDAS